MKKFDSILFDLDGTLASTVDCCVQTLAEQKKKYPDIQYDITPETVKGAMGLPFEKIVEKYYGYLEREKAEKYAKEAFEKNVENLLKNGGTLYLGVQNTVQELAKNFKLCIVSNCIEGYIEAFLQNHHLEKYFCDYENHGRTGLSKGENIQLVMQRNQLKSPIYVGDTQKDLEAANFAGIPFAFASYGFGEVTKCDYQLNKIEDLLKIINEGGDDIVRG